MNQDLEKLNRDVQALKQQIQDLQASKVWNGMSSDTRQNIGDCVVDSITENTYQGKVIFKNKIYPFPLLDNSGNLPITGNVTVGGNLAVTGTSAFTGAATFASSLTTNGTLVVHAGLNVNANVPIGYVTGSGGTVTQTTSRSTGVTLSTYNGTIITDSTSLAAGASATFTVTNTLMFQPYGILLTCQGGQTANTSVPFVSSVATGSFNITLRNLSATTADTGAMTISFIVLRVSTN